jgi:hypothetical protein
MLDTNTEWTVEKTPLVYRVGDALRESRDAAQFVAIPMGIWGPYAMVGDMKFSRIQALGNSPKLQRG